MDIRIDIMVKIICLVQQKFISIIKELKSKIQPLKIIGTFKIANKYEIAD